MEIGEVSKRAGLASSAIRYYEREQLLSPPARLNGRRQYSESVFQELTIVRMAQDAGFTVPEIRHLVRGFSPETAASERWQTLARTKLTEVEHRLQRLERMRAVLIESLQCECLTLTACAEICWSEQAPESSGACTSSITSPGLDWGVAGNSAVQNTNSSAT